MLKFLRERPITYSPLWALGSALLLWALAPVASAESLPAGVRACAAESDPGRRLACFDKAVASFPPTPSPTAVGAGVAAAALPAQPSSAVPASASPGRSAPAAARKQAPDGNPPQESSHVTARVVNIEYARGGTVLHLDNGQVWEQVQEPDAELNLRAGDSVTIDKILGAYWLGGRSSGTVKVKQRQ